MKKMLALSLALVMVLSLGAVSFAAPSVVAPATDAKATASIPEIGDFVVVDANGTPLYSIDKGLIKLTAIGNADTLSAEDRAAFEQYYADAKNVKDGVVTGFFWFECGQKLKEGEYFRLVKLAVPGYVKGDKVIVLVNGTELPESNIIYNDDGTVDVLLSGSGAITVILKKQ